MTTEMVFVHGVNGPRSNAAGDLKYQAFLKEQGERDANFKKYSFAGGQVNITNCLWSPFGAHPAWDLKCVPHAVVGGGDAVALGGLGQLLGEEPAAAAVLAEGGSTLVPLAKADPAALIGSLSTLGVESARATGLDQKLADAEAFWARAAALVVTEDDKVLFANATTDADVLRILAEAVAADGAPEALGLQDVLDGLKNLGGKLAGGATNLLNSPAVIAVREKLTPAIAIFIGDVFAYLKAGPARTAIRAEVLGKLGAAARTAHTSGGRLVAAGHSMGGVILYDLLSDPAVIAQMSATLGFSFKMDLLLTVGSQVALFEELKVFNASNPALPSQATPKAPLPAGAGAWFNVFNRLDVLSFLAEPVFDQVKDYEASTTAGIADAHGAYFSNMVFYKRLNVRMTEAGLL